MSTDTTTIYPTTLYAMDASERKGLTMRAASVPTEDGDALMVFRSEADAEAYRSDTGKHPASEGWKPLPLDRDLLAGLLEMHGLTAVVLPEKWTGSGGVDLFTAEGFLELLDTAEPVG